MALRYIMKERGSKGFFAVALVALALSACSTNNDDTAMDLVMKTAVLSSIQQTTAVTSNATGYGTVIADPMTRGISGYVEFFGLGSDFASAHIHVGAAGVNNATSLVTLTQDPTNLHKAKIPSGTMLSPENYDKLLAGELYFNVHSASIGTGEIRGQIGRIVMKAAMTGAEAVTASTATGTGIVIVDPVTRGITGDITYTGVIATAAHIHTGAVTVSGAPIPNLIPIPTVGATSASIATGKMLTEIEYDDLLAGKLYFNVHSAANPNGEIRGQIGPVAMVADLTGLQEVPAVTTTATGKAVFTVDPVTRVMKGGVGYTGLVAKSAHIHLGAAGVSGAPIITLTVDLTTNTNTAVVPNATVLDVSQYAAYLAGNLYVNIHTETNAGGEIRGQIARP